MHKSNISGNDVPPGALISFLQKGLQYLELEANLNEVWLLPLGLCRAAPPDAPFMVDNNTPASHLAGSLSRTHMRLRGSMLIVGLHRNWYRTCRGRCLLHCTRTLQEITGVDSFPHPQCAAK